MESAAIGILALSGIAAVAAILALAFGRWIADGLDAAFAKWRRLGFVGRIIAAAMVVVATVEAQKDEEGKCLNVGMRECLNEKEDDSLFSLKHSNIPTLFSLET